MQKEIKVIPPEGYCVDVENSTFECIKFKPKGLTYEDVAKKLFKDRVAFFIDGNCKVSSYKPINSADNSNNCVSAEQIMKLLALNKLINVAKYLNENWVPDYLNSGQPKFYIFLVKGKVDIYDGYNNNSGVPCFRSKELTKQAIEILGEETIKLAL